MSRRREIAFGLAQLVTVGAFLAFVFSSNWEGAATAAITAAALLSVEAHAWRTTAMRRNRAASLMQRINDAVTTGDVRMEDLASALHEAIEERREHA